MLEFDDTKDPGSSTRGEKITYYIFQSFMLISFSLEILTDATPEKWLPSCFSSHGLC